MTKAPIRGHVFSSERLRYFTLRPHVIEWSKRKDEPPFGHFALDGARLQRVDHKLKLSRGGETLLLRGDDIDRWEESLRIAVTQGPASLAAATPAHGADAEVGLTDADSQPQSGTPNLQLEEHVKARGQDNPQYPRRQPVSDKVVAWGSAFPEYAPEAWTHQDVLANNRELSTGNRWADPPDVARAGLQDRVSYAGDGQRKPLDLDADGMPQNPVGRTGLRGRGLLGKWGPNHAADPIVTRHHPETGKLQMVAIQRKDTRHWAIPGGMVDDGEAVSATLRREFAEEAGNIADGEARSIFEAQVSVQSCNTLLLLFRPVPLSPRFSPSPVVTSCCVPPGNSWVLCLTHLAGGRHSVLSYNPHATTG